MELKTVLIITVATARMMFPGIPAVQGTTGGEAASAPAARSVSLDLWSDKAVVSESKAEATLPAGLKIGGPVQLQIEPSAPPKEGAAAQAETPNIVLKSYWGCGESIADGQPKIAKSGEAAAPAPQPRLPDTSYAYWPTCDPKPIPDDASAVGDYALKTDYAGSTSITLDPEQDFLAPIDMQGLETKKIDLSKPVKVEWKSVPGALGYLLSAYGGTEKESVTWTSSADPKAVPEIENLSISRERVAKYVEAKVLLPPNATSCTIPAEVFKGSTSVLLTVTAIGADKLQTKDGIETHVLVRSTASVPLFVTEYWRKEK